MDTRNRISPILITFKDPILSEIRPEGKANAPYIRNEIKAKDAVSALVSPRSDLIKGRRGARVKVIACVIVCEKEAKYRTLFLEII
jgi:hypothetical protein